MYTRHGAVGGRGGAREGTGKLGFTAAPGFLRPNVQSRVQLGRRRARLSKPAVLRCHAEHRLHHRAAHGGQRSFDNPEEGARPPRYQNWNFSIQRAITPHLTLTAGYVGGNGKLLRGGGRGIWSSQIHPRYLALGNLLTSQVNATTLAQAQAIIPDIRLPYANFRGTFAQMLRPFPQYSGVNADFVNLASSNYNSLQITRAQADVQRADVQHQSHLEQDAVRCRRWAEPRTSGQSEKTHGESDRRHVFNAMVVYQLPFGTGRAFNPSNVVARGVGQRLAYLEHHAPSLRYCRIGIIGAACNLPNAGGCRASYNPDFSGPMCESMANGAAAICWARGRSFSTRRRS